jgi:large subunit ribosomal protein L23
MFATIRLLSNTVTSLLPKQHRINQGYKMWMPSLPLVLLTATHATPSNPATAQFRILPKMTKHEVREYLTKIYDLPVKEVRTQNYLGKRMRIIGKRHIVYAKRPDYKKAFVVFGSELADVGLGGEVPGLQQQRDEDDE